MMIKNARTRLLWIATFGVFAANLALLLGPSFVSDLMEPLSAEAAAARGESEPSGSVEPPPPGAAESDAKNAEAAQPIALAAAESGATDVPVTAREEEETPRDGQVPSTSIAPLEDPFLGPTMSGMSEKGSPQGASKGAERPHAGPGTADRTGHRTSSVSNSAPGGRPPDGRTAGATSLDLNTGEANRRAEAARATHSREALPANGKAPLCSGDSPAAPAGSGASGGDRIGEDRPGDSGSIGSRAMVSPTNAPAAAGAGADAVVEGDSTATSAPRLGPSILYGQRNDHELKTPSPIKEQAARNPSDEQGETSEPEGVPRVSGHTADADALAQSGRAFRRIVIAYESMEPQHAAASLARLAARDVASVVRTLMAMNPRRAGAVLDAMSAKAPDTAAMLTGEMIAETSPAALIPAE